MLQQDTEGYRNSFAYKAATALPVILENGRKVFGPPSNYKGMRPSYHCELYVTRVPQQLDELGFLTWLHRIGRVYELRLMMDSGNASRGYAFVRFCYKSDALAAFELLKYLFVGPERICVFRSLGKNRLYVSGIPRQIPLYIVESGFKLLFPQMQSCTVYASSKQSQIMFGRDTEQNRGFAFVEFYDHEMALEVKKRLTPGRVRMWGVDLKVQWAKPKEELLRPPVGMKKTYGNKVKTYVHLPTDFCAELRLNCLANNLCIPIVVYGQSYRPYHLQYAGVLLKSNSSSDYSMFLFEIMVARMSDIHLVICELAVKQYERYYGKLRHHALFRVCNDTQAELVYTFEKSQQLGYDLMDQYFKSVIAIKTLVTSLELLAAQNSEKLLVMYKRSFLNPYSLANFKIYDHNPCGHFYSVFPKFRHNSKLHNNLNDMEIILVQAPLSAQVMEQILYLQQCEMLRKYGTKVSQRYYKHKYIERFTLKSQNGYHIRYNLRYVDWFALQTKECYHPTQRVNTNPIWIAGKTYQRSIYNKGAEKF